MGKIEESFMNVGNNFNKIPHLVIGKNKSIKKPSSPYKNWKNMNGGQESPKVEETMLERIKRGALFVIVSLIILYAGYRIIINLF